jgi:hypothetical protein
MQELRRFKTCMENAAASAIAWDDRPPRSEFEESHVPGI